MMMMDSLNFWSHVQVIWKFLFIYNMGLPVPTFHTGHGGSDGLHGYVPSLDHVVADTVSSVYTRSFLIYLWFCTCILLL